MLGYVRNGLGKHGDLILVFVMVGILMILFTPIPSQLLDLLIIANFSFGLLILLLTFYVDKPLNFSTFPSLLLIATLFRLSLNIAATRLILNDGDAGRVIGAIGDFVVSGNYVIGLIVFLVLIVVQYVVVTNGAQRVAEVAARFTLDSMPGKQMSIDADMNIGIIDEKEAQRRRREIEKEGSFYGAMDGASKFVKGDAIAGIVIILIDIIGGLTIGIAQKGLSWGEALQTYTLLTVGDGIVTQIPALIISTGTGIIVTRAASDAFLSQEIATQITRYPKALMMISLGLLVMMILPGIPAWPVLTILTIVAGAAWFSLRKAKAAAATTGSTEDTKTASDELQNIYTEMQVDRLVIDFHPSLASLMSEEQGDFTDRISNFRRQYAMESGLVIPGIKIRENAHLKTNQYEIQLNGVTVAKGETRLGQLLAINPGNAKHDLQGDDTRDPSYGLAAKWVTQQQREDAARKGYTVVLPETVLLTHVTEQIKQYASELLTRSEVERLIESVRKTHNSLVDELIPGTLSLGTLKKVLQQLLTEKVSIRNLVRIFEVLVDEGKQVQDPTLLAELVRQHIGGEICQKFLADNGSINVLILDPNIEKTISTCIKDGQLILDPRFSEQVLIRLAAQVEKMMRSNLLPVLVCSPDLRRYISQLSRRMMPHLSVISMSEVPNNMNVKSFAVVTT
ncbi:flagellar biosynthesis protein FlhA [Gynuella sunshinyii]|uniref:Flagellar biosynthesis protein FlhA n=1 Tax=Gynuella sunshinyii YC6258 TaxID=1445510 RepID=A0A0C5UZK1_9GAMM|nr:flagellar biosynthesis protein FlhA [Gynuella sunshinyii]AJQ92725.1 flagellar biosynthesis pathway, component FlhA [Gynuella sunshinyii YC6258]